jgi:hypothetical protein
VTTVLLALVAVVLLHAAVRLVCGPTLGVRACASREVAAPLATCSAWLRDAGNLVRYEQKVTSCVVDAVRDGGCTYRCTGWFFGVPWRATFDLRHTRDGGFSSFAHGTPDLVTGGFVLAPAGVRTRVTHWEHYQLPWWIPFLWAVRPRVEAWLAQTLEVEMDVVARSLEAEVISAFVRTGGTPQA